VDRVAVMNKGSIVELASREQLFSDPSIRTPMLLASALTPDPGLGIPALAQPTP
jgi:peptide/nickel transport system ATP-binding protein